MKRKIQIMTLIVLITHYQTLKLGIYLSGHVNTNQQTSKPNIFTETLGQDKSTANIDAFVIEQLDNNVKNIRYLRLPQFLVQQQLNVLICPSDIQIPNSKKLQFLEQNCIQNSDIKIYFNLDQESPVQYQQTQLGYRYSYGGLKYASSLLGSELYQDNNKNFELKNFIVNRISQSYRSEDIENKLKPAIINKTLMDIVYYYRILFDISKNVINYTNDLFCELQVNEQDQSILNSMYFRIIKNQNFLILQSPSQQIQKGMNIQLIPKDINIGSPLQNVIQNMGIILTNEQKQNMIQPYYFQDYYIQFVMDDKKLQIRINEDENQDLEQDQDQYELEYFKEETLSQGYMELKQIKQQALEIQIMICSGILTLSQKGNVLNDLNIIGCQSMIKVNNIQIPKQNKKDYIENWINQNTNSFNIQEFPLESVQVNGEQNQSQIKVIGFKNKCDLLYDSILSVLFVLCYLKYSGEGFLSQFTEKLDQNLDTKETIYRQLNEESFGVLRLDSIQLKRRILGKIGNTYVNDGELKKYLDTDMCEKNSYGWIYQMVVKFLCFGYLILCIESCSNKKRRLLTKKNQQQQITLEGSLLQFDSMFTNIENSNAMTLGQFQQSLNTFQQITQLNKILEIMESNLETQFTQSSIEMTNSSGQKYQSNNFLDDLTQQVSQTSQNNKNKIII